MTVASVGWLKTVGLKDYECKACGWNVAAGEPRVYSYAGEGRPHKVWTEYRLSEKGEPVLEINESVHFVYHHDCYEGRVGDSYHLTDEPNEVTRLLDLGESNG